MPQGMTLSQARIIDPILSTMSIGVETQEYVMSLAFPSIFCPKRAVNIIQYGSKQSKYLYTTRRAPGSNINRVNIGYGDTKVSLVQDAIESEITYEMLEESDNIVDLQGMAVAQVKRILAHRLEFDQAALLGNFALYPATNRLLLLGANQFSDPLSPIENIFDAAKAAVLKGCNRLPNTMIFGSINVYNAVKRHPYFKNQFNRSTDVNITAKLIASSLDMQKYGISTATWIDPANPNVETDMLGNKLWIGYVPGNGDAELQGNTNSFGGGLSAFNPIQQASNTKASFGYTYLREQAQAGGQGLGVGIMPAYEDKNARTWYIQGITDRIPALTGLSCGYLFDNVTT
jgi:hypothetical protein